MSRKNFLNPQSDSHIENSYRFKGFKSFSYINETLKNGIWIYYLLLIFEGALRKWVLPGLATPLLIIRDPIALWIVITSIKHGLLRYNVYVTGMVIVGVVGIFTAIFMGHGNLVVAVYGARMLIFHFPLILIIGRVFNNDDVVALGKITLLISIPIAILVTIQFYSPQSAWVNRGVGGDIRGAGFSGALGYSRPPATFSFTTGTTQFYSLLTCFIFYFLFFPKGINKIVLVVATICMLIMIPFSISRSLFFQFCITLIFTFFASLQKPKWLSKILIFGIICGIIIIILGNLQLFYTAVQVFSSRFEDANTAEGGMKGVIIDRYLGGMIGAFTNNTDLPLFGYGIGMGTNVGSMLLTGGTFFLIAEGEWGRLIGELGPIMGLAIIFIRLSLTFKIAVACYRNMLIGNLLPWMLLSFGLLLVAQGAWSQPTSLGFSIMIGGLMIASLRVETIKSARI